MKIMLGVAFIIFVLLAILGVSFLTESNRTVEKFCAVKYQHDVASYKECKNLDGLALIHTLTEEEKGKFGGIVPLEIVE